MARAAFSVKPFDSIAKGAFSAAVEAARSQGVVDPLPPGMIALEERERGSRYAKWRRVDANSKPSAPEYLGPEGGTEHQKALARLADLEHIADRAKQLRKLGYAYEDAPSAIVLAAMANAGLFAAGVTLVGTRAFNSLSNMLGYRVTPNLATEDVDLATPRAIKLATPMPEGGLAAVLEKSGIRFNEVPGLVYKSQPTSWKAVGKGLILDLLVAARSDAEVNAAVKVPGLGSHASALRTIDFLLRAPTPGIVIGKTQLIPVAVPMPAHFCWHKIAVASLRAVHMKNKADKDLRQAAAIAVCMEKNGDLDELLDAAATMPETMRAHVEKSFPQFALQFGDAEYRPVLEQMAAACGLPLPGAAPAARALRRPRQ